MGSIQSLLVGWGIILFSFLVLTFQNSTNQYLDDNYENEAIITATSIGQSIIEKIQTKAFDENTLISDVQKNSGLSIILGIDSGEMIESSFDDIDDYHGYRNTIQMARLDSFKILINVYYINRANPVLKVLSRTFSKRVDVEIDNVYLKNPIKLNSIISY